LRPEVGYSSIGNAKIVRLLLKLPQLQSVLVPPTKPLPKKIVRPTQRAKPQPLLNWWLPEQLPTPPPQRQLRQ
jgi:hypothetical protein